MTFRRIARLAGPDPQPNPPRVRDLVVDGRHDADATTLRLRGAVISGRFLVGDVVNVAGVNIPCAGTAIAAGNAVSIPLAQPIGLYMPPGNLNVTLRTQDDLILLTPNGISLAAPRESVLVDGATVAGYAWAADRTLRAVSTPYPRALVDGQLILPTDTMVRVAAADFPADPQPQDMILVDLSNGQRVRLLTVVSVQTATEGGTPVIHTLQARAT